MFNVIEKFISVDGEGPSAGELAVFIRFEGCNLRCKWCDTHYSWNGETKSKKTTKEELIDYIIESGIGSVTLTGGEPLIQKGITDFLDELCRMYKGKIQIETNGSIDLSFFKKRYKGKINYIIDYKLITSGMTDQMEVSNVEYVGPKDVYKFVLGSQEDLNLAYEIIQKYKLQQRCKVHLSTVYENFSLQEVVAFMKEKKLNQVRLQPQLHKLIWHPNDRGV
jgi:7-carboxy-7-deazaguanine synthase